MTPIIEDYFDTNEVGAPVPLTVISTTYGQLLALHSCKKCFALTDRPTKHMEWHLGA